MPATEFSLKDAPDYFGGQFRDAIVAGARRGILSAANRMVNIIVTETIPNTKPTPVDLSIYRAAWRADEDQEGAYYENDAPHAGAIEDGVKASRVRISRQMITNLTAWVGRKFGWTGAEAAKSAWRIALAMTKHGIFNRGQGLKIMQRATEQHAQAVIEQEVEREVLRALGLD